jgi:hypothetical protein
MSLYEITSLESGSEDYKLFEDDPFLLEPDDSYLADDISLSDEADSLTDSLSPVTARPCIKSEPSDSLMTMMRHQVKQEPAEFPVMDHNILTPADAYLQVHDYCIGTNVSSCSVRSSSSSPGLRDNSSSSIDHNVSPHHHHRNEDDMLHMLDEELDCDEDEDDEDRHDEDEVRKCSRKSNSSSTSSPTSSVGHRRKSQMDRSLSEEEKRLLQKEG